MPHPDIANRLLTIKSIKTNISKYLKSRILNSDVITIKRKYGVVDIVNEMETHSIRSKKVLEDLTSKIFYSPHVIGSGSFGVVLSMLLKGSGKKLIAKIKKDNFVKLKILDPEPYTCIISNILLSSGINPHGMYTFNNGLFYNGYDNRTVSEIMFNEYIDGRTFDSFITNTSIPDKDVYGVFFQILTFLFSLYKYGKIIHNDLHYNNILIVKKKSTDPFVYKINDKLYTITCDYYPIVIDYGEAIIFGMESQRVSRLLELDLGYIGDTYFKTVIPFNLFEKQIQLNDTIYLLSTVFADIQSKISSKVENLFTKVFIKIFSNVPGEVTLETLLNLVYTERFNNRGESLESTSYPVFDKEPVKDITEDSGVVVETIEGTSDIHELPDESNIDNTLLTPDTEHVPDKPSLQEIEKRKPRSMEVYFNMDVDVSVVSDKFNKYEKFFLLNGYTQEYIPLLFSEPDWGFTTTIVDRIKKQLTLLVTDPCLFYTIIDLEYFRDIIIKELKLIVLKYTLMNLIKIYSELLKVPKNKDDIISYVKTTGMELFHVMISFYTEDSIEINYKFKRIVCSISKTSLIDAKDILNIPILTNKIYLEVTYLCHQILNIIREFNDVEKSKFLGYMEQEDPIVLLIDLLCNFNQNKLSFQTSKMLYYSIHNGIRIEGSDLNLSRIFSRSRTNMKYNKRLYENIESRKLTDLFSSNDLKNIQNFTL